MHPFSSDFRSLYKTTHFASGSGVKFTPRHPVWWTMFSSIISMALMLGGAFFSDAIFGTKGGNGAVLFAAPGFLLFIYTLLRIDRLVHTYGSQKIGSITISEGVLSLEILDSEIRGALSWFAPIQAFFGRPMRKSVIDHLNLPLSALLDYEWKYSELNDSQYASFAALAFENTIIPGGEEEPVSLIISPFFRKEQDVIEFMTHMLPYLDAWDGTNLEILEAPAEHDPSYA